MLARAQRLLARHSLGFPIRCPYSPFAKALPVRSAYPFAQFPLFVKPFSSLSGGPRHPPSPSHSEFDANAALLKDGEKQSYESADVSPPDGPSPDPSVNPNVANSDAAALPTNLITRTALVGASVGLLTPFYVAAGVGWIWQTYKPSTFVGQAAKFAIGGVFLGAAYVNGWTLVTQHLFPFVCNHAEIVLPFAVANAAVASAWYAICESIFGLQRMSGQTTIFNSFQKFIPGNTSPLVQMGLPLGGPLVGALTALTCFPLWEPLSQRLWPQELLNACDSGILANVYLNFLPVGLGTGALVGLGLHFVLAPIFTGRIVHVGGVPVALSLLLVVLALSLCYFYFCRFDYSAWEQRMDADSGSLYWAHSATGLKTTSSDRLLNDTLWFLKGLALFCNINSMKNNSHFCFVNKRLLADTLVADAKLNNCSHGSPIISDAIDQSKLLLSMYYRINLKDLNDLILQLLRVQHDLRMALSLPDGAPKANAVERCAQSKAALVARIRALGSNPDAATAIDHLLSDLVALESRLTSEAGLDFSHGTGIVNKVMSSLKSFALMPATSAGERSNRKGLTYFSILIFGGILLYVNLH